MSSDKKAKLCLCPLCTSKDTILMATVESKPPRETDFKIKDYHREIWFCKTCKVYFNKHDVDITSIYTGDYNKATYDNRLGEKYDQIMALPDEKSDNKGRVKRIVEFLEKREAKGFGLSQVRALDIGSGLCVFLGTLKKHGLKTYCLDPDPLSVRHAKEYVKVDCAWQGSIETFDTKERFELITFNKVLEHVESPISMLKKSAGFLAKGGVVYIELPSGKGAEEWKDTKDAKGTDCGESGDGFFYREEFYLEHNFIFTKDSARFLVEKAGFEIILMDEIHEPSDKYSIYAFIRRKVE